MTSLTIMHEAAHYGFFKTNGLKESKRVAAAGQEIGAKFEGAAFQRFSYTNKGEAMDEDTMREYYNAKSASTGMFGMSLLPGYFNININRDYLKNYPAPKPNESSGSGGDPHINPPKPNKY